MLKKYILAASALVLAATASNAAIVSFSPTVLEIAAPALVNNSGPNNDNFVLTFNEKQRYTLTANLTTDQGTILAGTVVDSHMVLFNKVLETRGTLSQIANIVFSGDILGVISFRPTLLASDFLGAPTVYADFVNRGLDEGKLDSYSFADATLDAEFFVNTPGDWIRVVTVATVPVPAGALLLPLGLAALAGLRRRRKTA